jgi:cell wall-associated NlpC family hydrolase
MEDVYQHARADGRPDWTEGRPNFESEWEVVGDLARFHRGGGFRFRARPKDDFGAARTLSAIRDRIAAELERAVPKTVFELRAESDGWSMLIRRVEMQTDGERIVAYAEDRMGKPYRLGSDGPDAYDCSGLTKSAHAARAGVALPHNAAQQHGLFRGGVPGFITITRAEVKRGDMVFTNRDEHVVLYYGEHRGVECCIDTEPSDTSAPWGGMLGTGIRIRPMTGNYYNAWTRVTGVGRIVAVNGLV